LWLKVLGNELIEVVGNWELHEKYFMGTTPL
jgi:hypothetical protein